MGIFWRFWESVKILRLFGNFEINLENFAIFCYLSFFFNFGDIFLILDLFERYWFFEKFWFFFEKFWLFLKILINIKIKFYFENFFENFDFFWKILIFFEKFWFFLKILILLISTVNHISNTKKNNFYLLVIFMFYRI